MNIGTSLLIVICVVAFAFLVAYFHERHRLHLKRRRFLDRESERIDLLLEASYPNSKAEYPSMTFWWKKCASILKLDANKLRPSDRFDGILAPEHGFYTEDETVALAEFISDTCDPVVSEEQIARIETFGEAVQLLTRTSRREVTYVDETS